MSDANGSSMYETYPFIAPEKYAGSLKGKVAIVTGTSVGIGRAIAKAMAAAGASVACIARREPELKSLVSEIESAGGHAIPIVADVAARGASTSIVSRVEKELGPIDILINNAAISRISPLSVEDEDIDIWWRVYEVNVRAPVALTRAVLPGMVERKKGGFVVSISSGVATMALPVMSAYATSKAAITKFHESITPELDGTGIVSYAICPGMVKTELGAPADAINKGAAEHPAMKAFMASISSGHATFGTAELAADTVVAAVADPRFKVLNGHHFSAGNDVERIVLEGEKEGKGRLGSERLHLINIGRV